jgi:hypothetical protein
MRGRSDRGDFTMTDHALNPVLTSERIGRQRRLIR